MNVRDNTNAFLTSGEIRMRLPSAEADVYKGGPVEGYCIRAVLTQAEYDERRRRTEENIWKAIEESDIQIRDCSGEIVRRDTHEICWERTSEEQLEDGIFRVGLRPYIQPIKSELMP